MFDSFRTMVDALLRSGSILTLVRTIEIEMRTSRMPPDSLFRMLGGGQREVATRLLIHDGRGGQREVATRLLIQDAGGGQY